MYIFYMSMKCVVIFFLVFLFASDGHGEQNICPQKVIIKNSSGKLKFEELNLEPGNYLMGSLIVPRAMTVDSKGNIYIGDSVKYRVLKFDQHGNYTLHFKLQSPHKGKKIHSIQDMAVDKEDNLYVINRDEYRVEVYTENGKFMRFINYADDAIGCYSKKGQPLKGYRPQHINVDTEGNIYLFHRETIYQCGGIYSPQGHLIKKGIQVDYHGRGKLNYDETKMTDFNGYYYVLPTKTTDKTVMITDKNNNVIKRCDNVDLATDEDNEIYKTDRKGNIYTFDYYKTLNVLKITPFKD